MDMTLFSPLIVAAVPLLVAAMKKYLPRWTLPILAAILGVALDALTGLTLGPGANPLMGALMGLAGVGLREIVDQLKKEGIGG